MTQNLKWVSLSSDAFTTNNNTLLKHGRFPADSEFVERAARFSLFGCRSFSEMLMNQQSLGVPESVGLVLQVTEIASGSKLGNGGPLRDATKVVKDRSNGSCNVSDSQSSGLVKCGETYSKGFNSKKRKIIRKVKIGLLFCFVIFFLCFDLL